MQGIERLEEQDFLLSKIPSPCDLCIICSSVRLIFCSYIVLLFWHFFHLSVKLSLIISEEIEGAKKYKVGNPSHFMSSFIPVKK